MEIGTNIKKAMVSVVIQNFVENLLDSSSSSEDSDFEIEMAYIYTNLAKKEHKPPAPAPDYVALDLSRNNFKKNYRMYPETFEFVLSVIGPAISTTSKISGKKPIPASKQLLIALWFMSTPDSYRSVCQRFNVGSATAFRAVRRVSYALHCVAPRFIVWPTGDKAMNTINLFEAKQGFPGIIGAIDGTHIKIRTPNIDGPSYINRKGFASIQLQVVCDARGLFTHCYAGHVGSVHDARVFRNSPVYTFLGKDTHFPLNSHIIGDAAYPIHPNVMVPFRDNGHLTQRQRKFNYCLSSTRMAIERAIGSLKIRFRILLDCLPLTDVKKIPEFILACCVLHNICVINNDQIIAAYYPDEDNIQPPLNVNILPDSNVLGNAKRNDIMNNLE